MKNILFITLLLIFAFSAEAKELYVNGSTGNDSTTYANNDSENPWLTIGRAVWGNATRSSPNTNEAAQAGDNVTIEAGTYDATQAGGAKHYPYYNPANNGTPGNYITFQVNGTVTLESSHGDGRPLIGSYQKDYIVWDGFTLNENNMTVASDTGPVVIWDCEYVTVKNLHITGINQSWGDNHNGIRIEGETVDTSECDNITVQNCYITGFSEDHGSGVTTYNSTNVLLENNEVTNSQQGLFVKGANNGPFIIRYNLIHTSVDKGIRLGGLRSGGAEVYQNVLYDVEAAFYIADFASNGPQNVQIVNNTVYATDDVEQGSIWINDLYGGVSNVELKNNIITDSDTSGIHVAEDDIFVELDSDYNCVYNNTNDFRDEGAYETLAQWRSAHSQDANSITSNPLFLDAGNNNFRLDTGSPCEDFGIDVLDLDNDSSTVDLITIGAYITGDEIIGIDDGDSSLISIPGNLAIHGTLTIQ